MLKKNLYFYRMRVMLGSNIAENKIGKVMDLEL